MCVQTQALPAAAAHTLMVVTIPHYVLMQSAVYPHGTQAAVDTPSSQDGGRMRLLGGTFALKAFVLPGLAGKTQLHSPGCRTPQSVSYPV